MIGRYEKVLNKDKCIHSIFNIKEKKNWSESLDSDILNGKSKLKKNNENTMQHL